MISKLKSLYKNKKAIKISVFILTLLFVGSMANMIFANSHNSVKKSPIKETKKEYITVYPKKINDDKKLLIGKVLSNESASIYPRRDGIVADILVDIGDIVKKGQVLAYLLSDGVEDESALEIQIQRNMMLQSEDNYKNTEIVSQEHIKNLEKKLNEEKVMIERLKADNYKGDINDDNLRLQKEQLALEYQELNLLEVEYSKMLDAQRINKNDVNNEVIQAKNNYKVTLDNALLVALNVLAGAHSPYGLPSGANLRTDILPMGLGVFNPSLQNRSVDVTNQYIRKFNEVKNSKEIDFVSLHLLANEMLLVIQDLIRASGNGGGIDLQTLSNSIISAQDQLNKAKESYEDAYDSYWIVQNDDEIKLAVQLKNIDKQKVNIEILESTWEKNATEIESKILIQEAAILRLEQEIKYEKSYVKKDIDDSKNQYNIAKSNYYKTAAQKGHIKITAPFNGTIARRNINVGELAEKNMVAFDLVDVKTTLSKKAENEIQFGLPEDLQAVLAVGQEITFYLPNDELTIYKAKVTRMSPQIDEALHTITVQAKLLNDVKLAHHTSVQVEIVTGKKESLQIESSALKRDGDNNYVWVRKDEDTIEKKFVDVIEEDGEFAEIRGELDESTMILVNYYERK